MLPSQLLSSYKQNPSISLRTFQLAAQNRLLSWSPLVPCAQPCIFKAEMSLPIGQSIWAGDLVLLVDDLDGINLARKQQPLHPVFGGVWA